MSSSVSLSQGSRRNFSSSSASLIFNNSLTGGSMIYSGGQRRMSRAAASTVYPAYVGGAASSALTGVFDSSGITTSEKVVMQNLNDRLASYLEKVRTLEAANRKLELQIRQYLESNAPVIGRDWQGYFNTIRELRAQIQQRYSENQRIILQTDNAQMAAEDFKTKQEMEMTVRVNAEADINRLRGFKDSLNFSEKDLKMQVGSLMEELAYLKSNHEEEMRLMRAQVSRDFDVVVKDQSRQDDLAKVMAELRDQYESIMIKNKQEQERWFSSQMESLQLQISTSTTDVKTFSSELSELKRTYQALEISLQGILKEIECLQRSLEEVGGRYNVQLSQFQITITALEVELQQLKLSIETQQTDYKLLLDIKMRLEMEIAEYRRLLEGEIRTNYEKKVVVKQIREEPQPVVEQRVTIIKEQVIDGKVVSSVVDTQTEKMK